MKSVLFIANISHNLDSLNQLVKQPTINITELFGASNIPLGVLSIEAYVKAQCPDIVSDIVDLNIEFIRQLSLGDIKQSLERLLLNFETVLFSKIDESIQKNKPNIIVFSTLFDKSVPTLISLSSKIKDKYPEILLIAGGHPITNKYELILNHPECVVDALCLGEGEIPISKLVCSNHLMNTIIESSSFMTKKKLGNHQQMNLEKYEVKDLDEIPFYDYDAYFEKYGDSLLEYHSSVLDPEFSFNRQAVMMTSRGCPYNCVFCASSSVHGKKIRANSIQRVKDEIDYWVDKRRVNTISFNDDHFLFDVKRAIEICDYAGSKNVDIRFINGLAVAPINKELVECFVRNRVKEVHLALESGSNRVLKEIIHKPLSLAKASEVFELFSETDIFVRVFIVTGFPDETLEDVEESLQYLRNAKFHWASISSPTPISGSSLLNTALKKGQIKEFDFSRISFFNEHFKNDSLEKRLNHNINYTINLDINFVHNPYMRMGKYELAMKKFESILMLIPNHAFACYYLYQCMKKLDYSEEEMNVVKMKYNTIIENEAFWRDFANYFDLELSL